MPIAYHEHTKEFHLYNSAVSYVIHVLPSGQLCHLYYGSRLRDREDFSHLLETTCRSISSWHVPGDVNSSLEFIRQEYPSFGTSDFRQPAFEIVQENGSHISEFVLTGHKISAGKPDIPGLPHAYVEAAEEADTLELYLRDGVTGGELTLYYTIFRDFAVIARSAAFANRGDQTLWLDRAMSMSVDFPDRDFRWMQFSGAWAREREPVERELASGITAVESMRGHSSAHQNPFVILKRPHTTESAGEACGFSLVYSGNFLAQAEVDTYDVTRFSMGINPRNFRWKLAPGETFHTPEALMGYSADGLNGLSRTFHTLLQKRVARGPWRDRPRPVLLNNWEATGMDFTEEQILRIARTAADVGVELFVLDDGWFGRRTETSGLGDWFPDRKKLPGGVKGLSEKIRAMGMDFGIWIEPEMVNEDSDLYRAHPEFVLSAPQRVKSLGRFQMVLDFSNPEVVDYVAEMLFAAFDGAELSYIKWDMNRSITECYSPRLPADQQGEVYHRYIMGVYSLYEKLLARYPGLLIESCASGGSRFDAGMLYYAPQAWCSDDTDAAERVFIQYGSSYGYPVSSWGAHVSVCPNQQLGRNTPLATRANVAYFGAFGYEMDLNELSGEELRQVRRQIAFMKAHRALIQFGAFYRLANPRKHPYGAWMAVSPDRREAVVGYYKLMNTANGPFVQLPLQGLDPALDYRITSGEAVFREDAEEDGIFGGDELMTFGLLPRDPSAHLFAALTAEAMESGAAPGGAGLIDVYAAAMPSQSWHTIADFDSRLFYLRAVD